MVEDHQLPSAPFEKLGHFFCEYITEVHGTYDKLHGHTANVMTMLKFKANKRTSDPFGLEAGNYDKTFLFKIADHKIVGFHGNASDLIHKIGVHVLPILH
ncbi:unnamed protein product [Brassica oleracea var. botrytis]|uniref:Jacalin-type lectin domain-containing protein n=2 Tax=Brassica oleracea TaxID=3712 RepID=A0A0D3CJJ9_BRAOL|nr:unnamed protein product [Brassica oleracea]